MKMPQAQGKKRNCDRDSSGATQVDDSKCSNTAGIGLNPGISDDGSGKSRKRKRCDIAGFKDFESEFEGCDLEDAAALESTLRKVARKNSLTHEEMMKLLHKFVKNEHILALVTLKAEDELAKQKQATEEQRAIIITETPSVPKLTRAKARELNKTPIIKLSTLNDQEPEPEITALIAEDLHSDEEDEEYVFKEEDFVSDDEINTTVSDLESNPRTPQTPASAFVDSPIKLSDDRCFKIPSNKKNQKLSEEMRIAARTRSKLCLEQTTIEDLQSEFVPPDIEEHLETSDMQPLDEDWMQFLNDFTKPLSTSFITDDDDPVNDPEYVAAEKEPVDAEELRDVNISKKELSELIAELYDGLMAEGLTMENIDLETPRKFLKDYEDSGLNTPHGSPKSIENNSNVARQLDFDKKQECAQQIQEAPTETSDTNAENSRAIHTDCNVITSTINQSDYTFQANNSTQKQKNNNDCNEEDNSNSEGMVLIPIAQSDNNSENSHNKTITIDSSAVNTDLNLIAVPVPGQPNCYQLARVVANTEGKTETLPTVKTTENYEISKNTSSSKNLAYDQPYAINYVSIRRHIIAEYIDKFKTLQHAQDSKISSTTTEITEVAPATPNTSFTQYQYDLMQQQLRIHIQQLAQTFVQTYCHPELWKLAPKAKELLLDLQVKSKENVNFQVWNLEPAIELIQNWQKELDQNTPENTELMNFLYYETLVTNHYSRQIPRFHPRILECYLNSPVFLYPQYLPRMPFSGKPTIPVFSPVEAYLIAMGLEKHLKIIYDNKEKLSFKTTPLRVACRRLAKDTVCGKRYRRIWDHILHLQKVDYYNPIKYFFEHNKAPPVDHDPIWTFANNVVLPPKDRIPELPLVFQTYLQKKNEPPKPKFNKTKKSRKRSSPKASEAFRNSYLEFVREAVGQDLPIPNLFYDPVESSDTLPSDGDSNTAFAEKRRKLQNSNSTSKKNIPQSLTINVNYVYGNGLDVPTTSKNTSLAALPAPSCNEYSLENASTNPLSTTAVNNEISEGLENTLPATQLSSLSPNKSNNSIPDSTINSTIDLTQNNFNNNTTINSDCPVITYNFDWRTKTLQLAEQAELKQPNSVATAFVNNTSTRTIAKVESKKLRIFKKHINTFKLHRRIKKRASAYREKRYLKRRCEELITTYSLYLDKIILKYKSYPLIQHYYRRFKTLELYTYLLEDLKSICKNYSNNMSSSLNSSPNMKRPRCSNSIIEDDNTPSSVRQVRKLNRQEENFKQMILPDTPEEVNRKDAIYAFNFYEKVEDAFKAANKPEDCKKFNAILRSFDPKKDKVSDLYYKLEKLFLPDHPELAQVFLTFLLPSEAAEIGKFFEHFMINNMNTFINKLNIYFNKQPAQIRKIYTCLNDLAEDPDVTMKKVEAKILPLLKGNQFLIDWFMQQFPQNTPPERLFSKPELINLKDQQCNRSGEYVETITDPLDSSATDTQQQRNCQLRYINGRIFYGSKMLLPAKLSFMAASYKDAIQPNETFTPATSPNTCVHGIREYGEKRLQAATDLSSAHISSAEPPSDDQDKSEEEDISKTLVIDTIADEEDSCSSVELCDETNLRAHAARLNPSVYSTTCYTTVNATSTPNFTNNTQPLQHSNAKKTFLNFNEEAKLSPRKSLSSSTTTTQSNLNSPLATSICNSPINPKEKRKSPSKKTKSPLSNSNKHLRPNNFATPPMVVIHETNSAIQCAKRLKSLIDEEEQQDDNVEEIIDSKELIKIVARTKNSMQSMESTTSSQICENFKEERPEDLEFLPEHSALSPSPFPCLRMETDSNEEDAFALTTATLPPGQPADPISDVDCKIDIVTSLTADSAEVNSTATSNVETQLALPLNSAWTRDEDKIILIEMKVGSQNRKELYERIAAKLPKRKMLEITSRHQFLMDFLSKLQGK